MLLLYYLGFDRYNFIQLKNRCKNLSAAGAAAKGITSFIIMLVFLIARHI
jgi:hypothetical protein